MLLIALLFRKPNYIKNWLLVSSLSLSRMHRSQTQIPRYNFHLYLCMLVFEDRIEEGEREETSNPNGHWHLPSRKATLIRVDTSNVGLDYPYLLCCGFKVLLVLQWLLIFTAAYQLSVLNLAKYSTESNNISVINQVYLCHDSCSWKVQ